MRVSGAEYPSRGSGLPCQGDADPCPPGGGSTYRRKPLRRHTLPASVVTRDRNTPVLSVRGLHRTYGRGPNAFEALRGIDLDIRLGESVAIVGKSGSGKSTLMHLLALLDRPSEGTVVLDGRDVREMSGRELNRARNKTFGFVFQQFFLTPSQTTVENVMRPLTIAGVGRRTRRERALRTLDQLELGDKSKNRAVDLSGGQKQRAVIARALVNDPRIIFADEPTGNLDSVTGGVVEDILFDLNRNLGITLVIVTHDEDLAARCDRRIHIRDGRVDGEDAR